MKNIINTNNEVLEFYFKNPAYSLVKMKNKLNRFKSVKNFKPYDAYYIDELEKRVVFDENFDLKSKRKYLREMYNFAMKNSSYLFESVLFNDENAKKLFTKEEVLNIQKRKKQMLENIKNQRDFYGDDYKILISLVKDGLEDKKLSGIYKKILIKEKISPAEAEFIIIYTLKMMNKDYQAYVTSLNIYDEEINSKTNIEFDLKDPILEFNLSKIEKTNKLGAPLDILFETFKQVEALRYFEDVKTGKANIYAFEVALESIFTKYLNRKTLKKNEYRKRQIHLNAKLKFIQFLNELGFSKNFLIEVDEILDMSDIKSITKEEFSYLDEIIENYPKELDNYRIFRYFYNEDGSKKSYSEIVQNLNFNHDLVYIVNSFLHKEFAKEKNKNNDKKLIKRREKNDK